MVPGGNRREVTIAAVNDAALAITSVCSDSPPPPLRLGGAIASYPSHLAAAGRMPSVSPVTPTLVVHGGAGNPRGGAVKDEPDYHEALRLALEAGGTLLDSGAPALDAAEAAVRSLEDCPLFNAGRGAVLTRDGEVEMDAAVMDGAAR